MSPVITRRFRFPSHASVLGADSSTQPWSPRPLAFDVTPHLVACGAGRPMVSIIRGGRQ